MGIILTCFTVAALPYIGKGRKGLENAVDKWETNINTASNFNNAAEETAPEPTTQDLVTKELTAFFSELDQQSSTITSKKETVAAPEPK